MVNLDFYETMSFEIQRMSSETSLIWQSRSFVRDSGSKGNKWTEEWLCGGEYAAGLVSKKLRNEQNFGLEMIPKK